MLLWPHRPQEHNFKAQQTEANRCRSKSEVKAMSPDNRNPLDVLKAELDFIEKGGYGRSVRTPWQPTSVFQDSPSCLNFGDLERSHPCSECMLIDFVPPEARNEDIPCHHIPLNPKGETIDQLEWQEDQRKLESRVESWLRSTISKLRH